MATQTDCIKNNIDLSPQVDRPVTWRDRMTEVDPDTGEVNPPYWAQGTNGVRIKHSPSNQLRITVGANVPDKQRDDQDTRLNRMNAYLLENGKKPIPLVRAQQHGKMTATWILNQLKRTDLTEDERLLYELQLRTCEGIREGWGKLPRFKQFSNRSRAALLERAAIIDNDPAYRWTMADVRTMADLERVGRPKCAMLTATLPGSTDAAMRAIASWSGYIMNRIMTWIGDQSDGLAVTLWVWEPQKRGALHSHILVACTNPELVRPIMAAWRMFWFDLLHDVSAKSGVDLFERSPELGGGTWKDNPDAIQTDAKWLDKTAAGYLASYQKKQHLLEMGSNIYCPSRWSGGSQILGQRVRAETRTHHTLDCADTIDRVALIVDYLRLNGIPVRFFKHKYRRGATFVAYLPKDNYDYFADIVALMPQKIDRFGNAELNLFTGQYCTINPDRRLQEMNAARQYELECLDAAWETLQDHNMTALERMTARKKSIRQQRKDYGLPD